MAEALSIQIGKRVRDRRETMGLTREQLAEQAQLSVQFLADIEAGRKNMTTNSLYKVTKALNLSSDFILFGEADYTQIENMLLKLSKKDREMAENIITRFAK